MPATTQQILEHHLKAFGDGDLEGILEDYTEVSVLFTPDGLLRGPGEIRPLFEAFLAEFGKPGASFEMKKQIVDGETAFIVWSAETVDNVYELATDTFVIREGKIVTQSLAGKIVPKS
jgi:ketosteroid isomerase-like protein